MLNNVLKFFFVLLIFFSYILGSKPTNDKMVNMVMMQFYL